MLDLVQRTQVSSPVRSILERYLKVRRTTEALCEGLEDEEYGLQAEEFVSPPKWHLGHTTWFFENFLLRRRDPHYREFDPAFAFLFNSYYRSQGKFHTRCRRGMLGRPSLQRVREYRLAVDEALVSAFGRNPSRENIDWLSLIELGLNHEQQHQELLLADSKYNLFHNPLRPAFKAVPTVPGKKPREPGWVEFPQGVRQFGFEGGGFSFDNELPRHSAWLSPFALSSRLVTNGEYLEFVESGGYDDPRWWLDDGWAEKEREGWTSPLYWEKRDGGWGEYRLTGQGALQLEAPVCHVSYYEADAFASWSRARLPTEMEWECAARTVRALGVFLEEGVYHPLPLDETRSIGVDGEYEVGLHQLFGDAWEWTQSAYLPYPGFRRDPLTALGEYNGKFMINQMVLRGGSCVTPTDHVRASYRNFLHPKMRWYFSTIRLANDIQGGD